MTWSRIPRPAAAVVASAIIASYFAGDLLVYLAVLLVLFVLAPGAH